MITEVDPEKLNGPDVILQAMEDEKMTAKYLIKRLKREMNAKEVKIFNDKDDGIVYSKKVVAWGIRQKARVDAHKLRGDYPSEKHDLKVTGDLTVIVKKYDWEDDGNSTPE